MLFGTPLLRRPRFLNLSVAMSFSLELTTLAGAITVTGTHGLPRTGLDRSVMLPVFSTALLCPLTVSLSTLRMSRLSLGAQRYQDHAHYQ